MLIIAADDCCKCCNKEILDINESIEFMGNLYHLLCFRCKSCTQQLNLYNNNHMMMIHNGNLNLPYMDKYGNLMCINDYIRYVLLDGHLYLIVLIRINCILDR